MQDQGVRALMVQRTVPVVVQMKNALGPKAVAMPPELAQGLGLARGQPLAIRAAGRQVILKLEWLPSGKDHDGARVILPPAAARALGLGAPLRHGPLRLHMRLAIPAHRPPRPLHPHPAETMPPVVELGPLVGILVAAPSRRYLPFLRAARERHVEAFLFTPRGASLRRRRVYGYQWTDKGWRKRLFPWPDAIYDRYAGKMGKAGRVRLLKALQRSGSPVFNGFVGYKWGIYQRLRRNPDLRPYLPETYRLRSPRTLFSLLRRWRGVYLKPSEGHKGRGVLRVRRIGPGRYAVRRSYARGLLVCGKARLRSLVRRLTAGRRYLVQREIVVAPVGRSVWDVRALAQRNARGEWEISGLAARIGRPNSIVSNLHGGGRARSLEGLAAQFPGFSQLPERARQLALQVAQAVQAFSPLVGELGIDLGVDRRGKLWLIEVNPKPGRQAFRTIGGSRTRRAIYALPFEYSRFVSGFA